MSITLGYMLDAPGRPALGQQSTALAALGVDLSATGTVWRDRIERGSTRPRSQLVEREALLTAVRAGDTLVIAAPLCIGLSGRDAAWFLAELSGRGVTVIVSGDLTRIEPGQDTAPMAARVASAQNVHHVRVAKRRARKST